jgi:hypothetical protein
MANLSERLSQETQPTYENANLLSNGGMDIWQRGPEFPAATFADPSRYTADRWNVAPQVEVHQSNDVPNSTAAFSLEFFSPVDALLTGISTGVELTNPTIGPAPFTPSNDYTLSFWAKREESQPYRINVEFSTLVINSNNRVVILQEDTENATGNVWERFSITFNIDTTVPLPTNQSMKISIRPLNNSQSEHAFITMVKLEAGSVKTPFTRAGNNLAGELSMCQRYYQNTFMGAGRLAASFAWCSGVFPVTMRQRPKITTGSSVPEVEDINVGPIQILEVNTTNATDHSATVLFNLVGGGSANNLCSVNPLASSMNLDADFDQPPS